MSALDPGMNAPDFDLPGTIAQRYTRQGQLAEKGAILAFFKTECPTCQLSFPFIERLYQRLKGSPISFLAIGQNDAEEIAEFAAKYKLTMPFAMDQEPYPVSNPYGITNVPTLFLINAQGRVVRNLVGHSKDGLEKMLQGATKLAGLSNLPPIFTQADASVRATQPG